MLHILGMGYAFPNGELDNAFIEGLDIGTSAEWIMDKIGIATRRVSLPLDYIKQTRNEEPEMAQAVAESSPTELAVEAVDLALRRAGIGREDIGLILCNCCTPYDVSPGEAEALCRALGLDVLSHDLFTACPVFALHVDYLRRFQEDALPDYVLCVSTATLSQSVNYNDRSDAAIWGDGAAAWVVSPRKPGKLAVVSSSFDSDPTRSSAVVVDTFKHFHQDGRAVRDFSVRQTVRLIRGLEAEHDIDWSRDIFIGHQANRTMLAQITNNRKIPETSHWHNVAAIGNQAGAGAPATLAMNWDTITKDQFIVVVVVGAGLSWGSILLKGTGH